jgi:hypothetical protein
MAEGALCVEIMVFGIDMAQTLQEMERANSTELDEQEQREVNTQFVRCNPKWQEISLRILRRICNSKITATHNATLKPPMPRAGQSRYVASLGETMTTGQLSRYKGGQI